MSNEPRRPMIRVNGVLVPKHETEAPEKGVSYFLAEPPSSMNPEERDELEWWGGPLDRRWLALGIVYLNAEDAKARYEAMLRWEDVSDV